MAFPPCPETKSSSWESIHKEFCRRRSLLLARGAGGAALVQRVDAVLVQLCPGSRQKLFSMCVLPQSHCYKGTNKKCNAPALPGTHCWSCTSFNTENKALIHCVGERTSFKKHWCICLVSVAGTGRLHQWGNRAGEAQAQGKALARGLRADFSWNLCLQLQT